MRELLLILLMLVSPVAFAQSEVTDSVTFQGQLSGWGQYSLGNDLPLWVGSRYIPQLNYQVQYPKSRLIDFEVSLNINGSLGFNPFNMNVTDGQVKLYRTWARYSTNQLEIRLGLQKINFGSASMLRPLMWFDQIDPRDPLQLTDGVWGMLGRYYFLNNVNLWVWGLYGNEKASVWEVAPTNTRHPEFGGRLQMPVPKGEAAISYHHRVADTRGLSDDIPVFEEVTENRLGLDGKWDMEVGFWFEGSWSHKSKDIGVLTNQHVLNLGVDYTFGLGNGLSAIIEQLLVSNDTKAFKFERPVSFTGASVSYPLGMFDNLSAIVYYDWNNGASYNFVSWKKQFNMISFFSMLYWNPENNLMPLGGDTYNLMGGKGVQFMVVFNH